jgi:hypothetical protein
VYLSQRVLIVSAKPQRIFSSCAMICISRGRRFDVIRNRKAVDEDFLEMGVWCPSSAPVILRGPVERDYCGGKPRSGFIVQAYRQGIFPWRIKSYPLLWFSPIPELFSSLITFTYLAALRQGAAPCGGGVGISQLIKLPGCAYCSRVPRQTGVDHAEMVDAYVRPGWTAHTASICTMDFSRRHCRSVRRGYVSSRVSASKLATCCIGDHLKHRGLDGSISGAQHISNTLGARESDPCSS